MAYGLLYQGEFSSISEDDYRLEILRKDYAGAFYSLQMGAVPVVQNWGPDEPKSAVKGCSLTMNYLNKGDTPIESFFSDNDDEFMVIFKQGSQVLFVGFLVQDDIREPMLDYTHGVTLSANDNLGLLKDIALNKYNLTGYSSTTAEGDFISITVPTQNWIYLRNSLYLPVVGTPFTISGHPVAAMNGTFTPTVINVVSSGNYNVRTNTFTGDTAAESCFVNGSGAGFNFYGKNSLLQLIQICLQNTGLELETYIYANIYEEFFNTSSAFLNQTLIDFQTFISGEDFEDCYSVLTKILSRFNLTLFQALGRWNIIRWDELRYGTGVNGFIYDSSFTLTGTTTLDADLLLGFQQDTYPETGLEKTAFRPFQYVKETFNYNQLKFLLLNVDLKKVGALLRSYVNGTQTWKEYELPDWYDSDMIPVQCQRFLRIIYDNIGNEVVRYIVIKGNPGANFVRTVAAQSNNIEVNTGDIIKISFSYQTDVSQPGNGSVGVQHGLRIYDGVNKKFARNWTATFVPGQPPTLIDPIWDIINSFPTALPKWWYTVIGSNTSEWSTVTIETARAESSGIMNLFLANVAQDVANETRYKDFTIEVISTINESTKIIGQIHNDQQDKIIKNNQSDEIYIDDSPRNVIPGTLFRKKVTNLLQERTSLWHRDGISENKKLGEIITNEELQWRSVSRTRLDGSFRGLIQDSKHISMLNFFNYSELPGLNFLFGTLQIDYRNNQLSCSAWEMFKDGEADVSETYTFTYIYDTK